jgi:hypothetical protein
MFRGFQVTMVLYAALDLGIFDILHQQPNFLADASTLAEIMGVSKFGLKRLLESLVVVGLLSKEEGNFVLTETAAAHLVKGMQGYLGDLRHTLVGEKQWDSMRNLAKILKQSTQTPVRGVDWDNRYLDSQYSTPAYRQAASELLTILSPWARRKTLYILEVGCGSGLLSFTLMQRHSKLQVSSMDHPKIISIAKKYAEEMNVTDRVTWIETENILQEDNFNSGPYGMLNIEIFCVLLHRYYHSRPRFTK